MFTTDLDNIALKDGPYAVGHLVECADLGRERWQQFACVVVVEHEQLKAGEQFARVLVVVALQLNPLELRLRTVLGAHHRLAHASAEKILTTILFCGCNQIMVMVLRKLTKND